MLASGAIAVPVNPAYAASELAMLIEDAGPVLLVHGSATAVPEGDLPLRMTLEPDGSGSLPARAARA